MLQPSLLFLVPKDHRCAESPGPGYSKPAVTTHSESTALLCPCPREVEFLVCGGRGTFQSSRNGTLLSQLSSCMPQLYSMTLGEGHFVQNLKFPGPGHQGKCQQSQELAALPVPVGTALCTWRHVHASVQSVGLGAFREGS